MAGEINFAVSLEDHVSPGAKKASESIHGLTNGLKGCKEGLHAVIEPVEVVRHSLEELGNGLKAVGSSLKSGDIAGALDGATDAFAGMLTQLDLLVPGLGQASSAIVKVGGAVAGAFIEMAEEGVKTALEVSEVNERLTATFEALGDKPGAGKKTLEFLNKLSTELPQGRDELAKWAKEFEAFGITDLGQLRGQIEATASAQAIAGDEGAASYTKLAEKIQDAVIGHHKLKMGKDVLKDIALSGANARDVAAHLNLSLENMDKQLKAGTLDAGKFGKALEDTLKEKGKAPLEAMGNEIGTLKKKAEEVFFHLFDGIDTSPITDGIKGLIGLGDQGKASGQVMHDALKHSLQGIINWLGKTMHAGKILFLELELAAVKNQKPLKLVSDIFGKMWDNVSHLVGGVTDLIDRFNKLTGAFNGSAGPGAAMTEAFTHGTSLGKGGGATGTRAQGHAAGGRIGRPAPGEFFASVSPEEMILPVRQIQEMARGFRAIASIRPPQMNREIMGGGIGFHAGARFGGGGIQAQAGMRQAPHIAQLHLNIHAPHGVTDATSLTATGLALALERHMLSVGR